VDNKPFSVQDANGIGNEIVDLLDNSHFFKLDTAVVEHNCRLVKINWHESYNAIGCNDMELSRNIVKSLLSEPFQAKIDIQSCH
jgi:hypothetical protein